VKVLSTASLGVTQPRKSSETLRRWIGFPIVCVMTAAAYAAAADDVTVKIYGTVDGGIDSTGVFGSPGELNGNPFVATYRFNASPGQSNLSNGTEFVPSKTVPSVFDSASIEINGISHYFSGTNNSNVTTFNPPPFGPPSFAYLAVQAQSYHRVLLPYKFLGIFSEYQWDNSLLLTDIYGVRSSLPETIDENYSSPIGRQGGMSTFNIAEYVYVSNDVPDNRLHPQLAYGVLRVNYLTMSVNGAAVAGPNDPPASPPTAAVPEPASWVLMLSGFGALGGMLRRQRRPGPSAWPLRRRSIG